MGNECTRDQIKNPDFLKNNHHQGFGLDQQETKSNIIKTDLFLQFAPQNQYQYRQKCQQPSLSQDMIQRYSNIDRKQFILIENERGIYDDNFYKFKRSGNIYHGQWKNRFPHGIGTIYYHQASIFFGSFIEGVPFGKGMLIMQNGGTYDGEFKYGKANGFGQLKSVGYTYSGYFKDDLKHGEASQQTDQYNFKGIFQYGYKLNGTYTYDQCVYIGSFQEDQFSGKGELKNDDGSFYDGQFKNGRFHGKGVFQWKDGSIFKGSYANGLRYGYGQLYNTKSQTLYKGVWQEGILNGQGCYIKGENPEMHCTWRNSKLVSTIKKQK